MYFFYASLYSLIILLISQIYLDLIHINLITLYLLDAVYQAPQE
jgi:hypothetical protein